MAKWETYFFKMNRGADTEQTVAGVGYKGLALLKTRERNIWSLTHMRSGRRIIEIEAVLRDVRRIGATIAELIDWAAYEDGEAVAAAHPNIGAQITAIAEFETTGGVTHGEA